MGEMKTRGRTQGRRGKAQEPKITGEWNHPTTPEVFVNNLTEFAVSTFVSNPYDAVTNPQGVEEQGTVRLTIGTTDEVIRRGKKEWNHTVETLVLKPRN